MNGTCSATAARSARLGASTARYVTTASTGPARQIHASWRRSKPGTQHAPSARNTAVESARTAPSRIAPHPTASRVVGRCIQRSEITNTEVPARIMREYIRGACTPHTRSRASIAVKVRTATPNQPRHRPRHQHQAPTRGDEGGHAKEEHRLVGDEGGPERVADRAVDVFRQRPRNQPGERLLRVGGDSKSSSAMVLGLEGEPHPQHDAADRSEPHQTDV